MKHTSLPRSQIAVPAPPQSAAGLFQTGRDKNRAGSFRLLHPMASSMPPPSLASRKKVPASIRATQPCFNRRHEECDTHLSGVTYGVPGLSLQAQQRSLTKQDRRRSSVRIYPTKQHHRRTSALGCPKTPFFGQILCPVFGPGHITLECPRLLGFGLEHGGPKSGQGRWAVLDGLHLRQYIHGVILHILVRSSRISGYLGNLVREKKVDLIKK